MKKIIEALERKRPGSEVTYLHISGPVLGWNNDTQEEIMLDSDEIDELARAIDEAEEIDFLEYFK